MLRKIKLEARNWISVEHGPAATINLANVRGKVMLLCRYKGEDGKLLRKYYSLDDLKKANAFAADKNKNYKEHGAAFGSLTKDEARAIDTWRAYKKARMKAGRDFKDPAALMHEAIVVDNGRVITPLLPDIAKEYIAHLSKREKSLRHYITTRHHLAKFSELFADREIGEISTDELELAIYGLTHYRTGKPLSPVSMQSHRLSLSGLFTYAVRRGVVEKNVAALVEPPAIKRSTPGIISPETAKMILEEIRERFPDYLSVFTLAVFCGLRRAELTRLMYQDIDHARGEVRISKHIAKTGQARYCAIPECAAEWLALAPKERGEYVIPGESEYRRDRLYQKVIARTKKRLGVRLPTNAFRHSAASYLCAYHENLPKVAMMMGHSVHILNQNYRNAVSHEAGVAYYSLFPEKEKPAPA